MRNCTEKKIELNIVEKDENTAISDVSPRKNNVSVFVYFSNVCLIETPTRFLLFSYPNRDLCDHYQETLPEHPDKITAPQPIFPCWHALT